MAGARGLARDIRRTNGPHLACHNTRCESDERVSESVAMTTATDDVAHCRARGGELPDDAAAALERLEARGPARHDSAPAASSSAGPVEGQPTTAHEAVRRWLATVGARPGGTQGPSLGQLRTAFQKHATAAGWGLDDVALMGRVLKQLGYRVAPQSGKMSPFLNRHAARALLRDVPRKERLKRQVPRRIDISPRFPPRPLFHEVLARPHYQRAQPLVDTLGRVWPTARMAASYLPRVAYQNIHACAGRGQGSAAGCLWRYLTPEEVRMVPTAHRVGERLPVLAWAGTVVARSGVDAPSDVTPCAACDARRRAGTPTPPPQASHPPPVNGTRAGGPTHIPAQFSDV